TIAPVVHTISTVRDFSSTLAARKNASRLCVGINKLLPSAIFLSLQFLRGDGAGRAKIGRRQIGGQQERESPPTIHFAPPLRFAVASAAQRSVSIRCAFNAS